MADGGDPDFFVAAINYGTASIILFGMYATIDFYRKKTKSAQEMAPNTDSVQPQHESKVHHGNNTEKTSQLARRLKQIARWIGYIAVIVVIVVAAFYLYSLYERNLEVSYMTSDECVAVGYGSSATQLCEESDGRLYLRKVDRTHKTLSVSFLSDDPKDDSFKYVYAAYWFEDCEENTEVELARTYSDGTPFTLTCVTAAQPFLKHSAPSRLSIQLVTGKKSELSINEFGFKIDDNYEHADYAPLERKLALTGSETRELRKERQAEEERDRLAAQMNKQECEARNARAKNIFDREITEARQTMLGGQQVSHRCETFHETQKSWCVRYTFTVTNKTQFPIRNVEVRYEHFKNCSRKPRWSEKFSSRIDPNGKFSKKVKAVHVSKPLGTTIADVEFDAAFEPSAC